MKRRAAKLTVMLAALALAPALVACGGGGGGSGNAAAAGPSELQKVLNRGTLRVAVLPDFPPSSVKDPSGQIVGFEPDIAKKLADALGVKLQLVPIDGTARLSVMQSGRADVNISAYTATNERAEKVAFTIPYVAHGAGILYRKSNPITGLNDLAGKKVAVARGSTNDTIVTQDFPKATPVRFDNIADALQALKSGKVDTAMEDYTVVHQAVAENPNLAALNAPPIDPAIVSMGVLPGQQIWLNYLNNFIRNLISSGTDNALFEKWFHQPLPSVIGGIG